MTEQDSISGTPHAGSTIASRSAFLRLLANDPDGDTLVRALVRGPLRPYGAVTATLFLPDAEERNLILAGALDPAAPSIAAFRYVSLSVDLPASRAYFTGQTLFLPQETWVEQYPPLAFVLDSMPEADKAKHRVLVTAPVLYQGVAIGVLNFTIAQDEAWEYEEYTYLDGLLAAIGLWIRVRDLSERLAAAGLTGTLPRARAAGVTARQRVVLGMLAEGKSNEAIARALGYSVSTVKNDLTALMSLLAARDRHEILDRARAAGMLGDQDVSDVQVDSEVQP